MVSRRGAMVAGSLGLFFLLLLGTSGVAEGPLAVVPGVTHLRMYRAEGPWVIQVVEADLAQEELGVRALLAGGRSMGRGTLSQMVARSSAGEWRAVAAVNADFFALGGGAYASIPLGMHVQDGELVTLPDATRSVLYVLSDRTAHIGRFRAKAWLAGPDDLLYPIAALNRPPGYSDVVLFTAKFGAETRCAEGTTQISVVNLSGRPRANAEVSARIASIAVNARQAIPAEGAVLAARGVAAYALRKLAVGDEVKVRVEMEPEVGEIVSAVGGGPRLVRDERMAVELREERFAQSFGWRRHPRTGIGLRDGRLLLVAVDGRQPGYSDGMTLWEFAQLFLELGCREAMNLDGGGSTTMVVADQVVNSPSGGVERGVANALAVFSTGPIEARPMPVAEAVGPPVRMSVEPAEGTVLAGERLKLVAWGWDEESRAAALDATSVRWECPSSLGYLDDEGVLWTEGVSEPAMGLVVARCGELEAAAVLQVVPAPVRLAIMPDRVRVGPGAAQAFMVRAYDDENRLIRLSEGRVVWSCEPKEAGATMSGSGVLEAPPGEGLLTVTARVGEVTGEAEVAVGAVSDVLMDFEEANGWSYWSSPEGLPGGVEVVEDATNPANHCLRLSYDFSEGTGTRAAHAVLNLPLPETNMITAWVVGDAQGAWLRARVRDGEGKGFAVDLADRVGWSGRWRGLAASLPEEAVPPLTLESVYVSEYHADRQPCGAILVDDIGAARRGAGGEAREE
jgi:hypothetical protein